MRLQLKLIIITFAIFLLRLCLTAQVAPPVSCPDAISPTDSQLAKPPEGWNVFVDKVAHRLSRVSFFDGPVEQNATLVPDKETKTGKTRTAVWLLQPKPERAYWLACYYSRTSLALSRALPSGLKECTVTYNTSVEIDGMPVIKSLSCK